MPAGDIVPCLLVYDTFPCVLVGLAAVDAGLLTTALVVAAFLAVALVVAVLLAVLVAALAVEEAGTLFVREPAEVGVALYC